ncbi:MAG: cyanophycinase [Moraxellaceae bacterium]|nr:cyanophycinase [Pseudobdellovibrionaceae bacterium]
MKTLLSTIFSLLILAVPFFAQGQQTLLLVGGGQRPQEALKEWVKANPAKEPKVLIITWASANKKQAYETSIQADLREIGVRQFLFSQDITNSFEKNEFVNNLSQATHIFFSGGSQTLIMNILNSDPQLMNQLQHAYWKNNIPVAGTSAGTAVQAELMITGDTKNLEYGLGFLPKTVIDQHFFKRGREDRLRSFMKQAPGNFTGIGVDEDGSILFKRDPKTKEFNSTVLGSKNIMVIGPEINQFRQEKILRPTLLCSQLF